MERVTGAIFLSLGRDFGVGRRIKAAEEKVERNEERESDVPMRRKPNEETM